MSGRPELKIDWATHEAAKYACLHWHYSKSLPAPPMVHIGVWEDKIFKGVVLFSRGAANNLLKPYGLTQIEGCELTRIALDNHVTEVSKIVSISLRFLKLHSDGLRLVISFADPNQGHNGAIYQAGNWIYTGKSAPCDFYKAPDGKVWHPRMVKKKGFTTCFGEKRATWKPEQCTKVKMDGKHRYLMPLDDEMRKRIEPLRKPYPKRDKQAIGGDHPHSGGAAPTVTLQNNNEVPNAKKP
jgi:hypothetical protein